MTDNQAKYEKVTCCHCNGLGCSYCDKKGWLRVQKPARKCRHCDGDCCIYCGFTGWENPKGKYD